MNKLQLFVLFPALLTSSLVFAEDFDKSLTSGVWSESINTSQACNAENLHNSFEFSDGGKTLVFKLDRLWQIANGKSVDHYSAKILESTKNSIIIEYNDIGDLPSDYPKTWEMVFVAKGVYRWRATSWSSGEVNSVVGIRCSE
jgi:hypothetical protein